MAKEVSKVLAERFADYVFDWDYETYLLVGAYGSSKSYNTACKIIFKLFEEKRKCLVVREVYDTLKESCYDLLYEILDEMELVSDDKREAKQNNLVYAKASPLEFIFPNGSRIIFRGMDKPSKVKSINGVSIVWLEECSEIKYEGYKELLGRIRTPNVSLHFILSCNPVDRDNWVYKHFFKRQDEDTGEDIIIMDEDEFYDKKTIVRNGVYYHHSVPEDNPFLPKEYIKRLDDIQKYDKFLYRVARWGRFGPSGIRVLPQFTIATNARKFKDAVRAIPEDYRFYGFDFGFEESYNAVVFLAVDCKRQYLYIYDEIYINHVTDDKMANLPEMQMLRDKQQDALDNGEFINPIVADNEDPKAIKYYQQQGFFIRACRNKFAGSRLSNTRKIKRFRKIICSPKCKNCIKELRDLTYKKDSKGATIYDEFNIDPHTFSAIWYALDNYTVADVKEMKNNSKRGAA